MVARCCVHYSVCTKTPHYEAHEPASALVEYEVACCLSSRLWNRSKLEISGLMFLGADRGGRSGPITLEIYYRQGSPYKPQSKRGLMPMNWANKINTTWSQIFPETSCIAPYSLPWNSKDCSEATKMARSSIQQVTPPTRVLKII